MSDAQQSEPTGPEASQPAWGGPPPPPPPPPPPGQPVDPMAYPAYPPTYGYVDPYAKSKIVAGLLGIFLGGLGIHRFYLGFTTIGVIQIIVTIVTCGIGALWGLVEGILYLVGVSGFTTDAQGRPLRD